MKKIFAPFLLILFITAGCAAGGFKSPETTADRLAAAEITYLTAQNLASGALALGHIDKKTGLWMIAALESSDTALDVAGDYLVEGKPKLAEEWIALGLSYALDVQRAIEAIDAAKGTTNGG